MWMELALCKKKAPGMPGAFVEVDRQSLCKMLSSRRISM
jgi:hypothetical protein